VAAEAEPNGLKTAWDAIVAPKEAFAAIRVVPVWGWALAIAILLSAAGSYLVVPALQHAFTADFPRMVAQNPALSDLTPAQRQAQLAVSVRIFSFAWIFTIFGVPFYCLVNSVIMLVFDKLGRGDGTFAKYWASACNIGIVAYGLQSLVFGAIALARGANSFGSMAAFQSAMPSLALLAPAAAPKLHAFLATVSVFSVWSTGLTIGALAVVGRAQRFQAWLGGLLVYLYPTIIAVWSAH
jgi:hypothetical protein